MHFELLNFDFVTMMKYELYHNLGALRSVWKARESKSQGGGRIYHTLCNVGLIGLGIIFHFTPNSTLTIDPSIIINLTQQTLKHETEPLTQLTHKA